MDRAPSMSSLNVTQSLSHGDTDGSGEQSARPSQPGHLQTQPDGPQRNPSKVSGVSGFSGASGNSSTAAIKSPVILSSQTSINGGEHEGFASGPLSSQRNLVNNEGASQKGLDVDVGKANQGPRASEDNIYDATPRVAKKEPEPLLVSRSNTGDTAANARQAMSPISVSKSPTSDTKSPISTIKSPMSVAQSPAGEKRRSKPSVKKSVASPTTPSEPQTSFVSELEDTEEARKRAIRLASQEEKIFYEPEDDTPQMNATSYPGQEWNPYGEPDFEDD